MPRFNQQGPMGEGPMTGRKLGKCTNYGAENIGSTEEPMNENVGRGLGMRRGLGFGRGSAGQSEGRGLAQRRGFGQCGGRNRQGRGRGNN